MHSAAAPEGAATPPAATAAAAEPALPSSALKSPVMAATATLAPIPTPNGAANGDGVKPSAPRAVVASSGGGLRAVTSNTNPTHAMAVAFPYPSLEELWQMAPELPSRVLPFLYLGGESTAMSAAALAPLGVTHVLNVSRECKMWLTDQRPRIPLPLPLDGAAPVAADEPLPFHPLAQSFCCERVPVQDSSSEDLLEAFPWACAFIDAVRRAHDLHLQRQHMLLSYSPPNAATATAGAAAAAAGTAAAPAGPTLSAADQAFLGVPPPAVLVHCAAGVSRSATVVTAYLMARCGLRHTPALRYLRSCRPVVSPMNFARDLARWEQFLASRNCFDEADAVNAAKVAAMLCAPHARGTVPAPLPGTPTAVTGLPVTSADFASRFDIPADWSADVQQRFRAKYDLNANPFAASKLPANHPQNLRAAAAARGTAPNGTAASAPAPAAPPAGSANGAAAPASCCAIL